MSDGLASSTDELLESLVAEVVDEFVERDERGERPNVEDYAQRHPQIADVLRRILPAVQAMRQSGAADDRSESSLSAAEIGQLGDFRLLREVGRGGMGVVYEAEQISLRRRAALQVLPFAAALDPRRLERFQHEAQAAAHLHHTHIVPVFGVGCERGVYYYAMQFIDGQSLAEVIEQLRQGGPSAGKEVSAEQVPVSAAGQTSPGASASTRSAFGPPLTRTIVQWGVQAAEALEHAHSLGVVHRDVKPANLLVDVREHLWVTDFGLAHCASGADLTNTGDLIGTLRYMSPEQAMGRPGMVDHRTDIYALGATLYELLTLKPLWQGHTREELLRQIASDVPTPPRRVNRAIPADLETILLKALAKEPVDRYGSARELADDLQRFVAHEPIRARRPSLAVRASKWARRHRGVVTVAVAALLLAVVALAASTAMVVREQARTQDAYEALLREQTQTSAALLAEGRQRALAEKNFQQAREMLDFFTQVFEQDLADQPETREVRNKLLQAALEYYQGFIRQSAGDPRLQAKLADSHIRVAELLQQSGSTPAAVAALEQACEIQEDLIRRHPEIREFRRGLFAIYYRMGVFRGWDRLSLVRHESVQRHLGLTAEQVQAINAWAAQQRDPIQAIRDSDNPAQLRRLSEQQTAAAHAALVKILTPPQTQRLEQLSLQRRGTYAFNDPKIADELKLSDDQRRDIRRAQEEAGRAIQESLRQGDRSTIRQQFLACQQEVFAILSDEQQARWQEMIGEPFAGDLRFPRGRGPRPPERSEP